MIFALFLLCSLPLWAGPWLLLPWPFALVVWAYCGVVSVVGMGTAKAPYGRWWVCLLAFLLGPTYLAVVLTQLIYSVENTDNA